MTQLINECGIQLMQLILTLVVSYVGLMFKKYYNMYINTEEKKHIINVCVKATEQLYKDLNGEAKKQKAIDMICDLLYEKGISITEAELNAMIEAVVQELTKNK